MGAHIGKGSGRVPTVAGAVDGCPQWQGQWMGARGGRSSGWVPEVVGVSGWVSVVAGGSGRVPAVAGFSGRVPAVAGGSGRMPAVTGEQRAASQPCTGAEDPLSFALHVPLNSAL